MTLQITITKKNKDKMEELAKNFNLSKSSFTNYGYKFGLLSEIIFMDNFGGEYVGNKHYDILLPPLGKIDIKTKVVNSEPKPDYDCAVSAYQRKNECDYYVFFRTKKDMATSWLLGGLSKEDFYKKAVFTPAGTRDGAFRSSVDSYVCKISDLEDIPSMIYGSKV